MLCAGGRGYHVDIRFFTDANLVSHAVDSLALLMSMQGEIVETAVSQTVAVIFGILNPGYEIDFC